MQMIQARGLTRHFKVKGETVEAVRGLDPQNRANLWTHVVEAERAPFGGDFSDPVGLFVGTRAMRNAAA